MLNGGFFIFLFDVFVVDGSEEVSLGHFIRHRTAATSAPQQVSISATSKKQSTSNKVVV